MSIEMILRSKYNENDFKLLMGLMLKNIVPQTQSLEVYSQYTNYIKSAKMIGTHITSDGKKIAILCINVTENSRAKTTQRNYVSHCLSKGNLFGMDGALVAYYDDLNPTWKLSLVTFDIVVEKKIEFEFKPARRYSFLVGEKEPSKTYLQQLMPLFKDSQNVPSFNQLVEAFSVTSVTEDFYAQYYKKFKELAIYLENNENFKSEAKRLGYSDNNQDEPISKFAITFAKKTLGQIVFLFFLQKKGWLGVEQNSDWGSGDRKYIIHMLNQTNGNYFDNFFEPLFYEALNVYRHDELFMGLKVPFLNGGLFTPIKNYNWEGTSFNIPNSFFTNRKEEGLVDIFSQYNFTVNESDGNDEEIAVDPEMLGKIFESLLDPDSRKETGAYYTPRAIVNYMVITTLARRISQEFSLDYEKVLVYIKYSDSLKMPKEMIEKAFEIDMFLNDIKILEPAVGSGAFLLGILLQIVKLRKSFDKYLGLNRSAYDLKCSAIKNSIYGVDLEYDAVEISKLRLWLSLIVEDGFGTEKKPKPLPNLNFNLQVGNSVVDSYHGVYFEKNFKTDKRFKKINTLQGILNELILQKKKYYDIHNLEEKKRTYNEIINLKIRYIKTYLMDLDLDKAFYLLPEIHEIMSNASMPFFFWYLEFYDVFKEKDGFDIVIANPPYIGEDDNKKIFDPIRQSHFGQQYCCGKMDILYLFFHLALDLTNDKGCISFITTNYYVTADGAIKLRNDFKNRAILKEMINFNELTVFDSATGQHNMITELVKGNDTEAKCKIINFTGQGRLSDFDTLNAVTATLYSTENDFIRYKKNSELYYNKSNYIALKQNDDDFYERIIKTISSQKETLKDLANVYQGIVSGANKVTKSDIDKFDNTIKINDGIFVLDLTNQRDVDFLNELNENEISFVKPYFKNSDIQKYYCETKEDKKILYIGRTILNEEEHPNLINHFSKFKPLTEERRENKTGRIKYYQLQWCREQDVFENEKIVIPYRAKSPSFAYNDIPWYFSSDAYAITKKDSGADLFYLLGVLNSKTYEVWFKLRGKMKGDVFEFFYTPLTELPIMRLKDEDEKTIVDCAKRLSGNPNFEQEADYQMIDNILRKYILE